MTFSCRSELAAAEAKGGYRALDTTLRAPLCRELNTDRLFRPRETRTIPVQGHELDEIQEKIAAETPAGWETISAPVSMSKRDTTLTAEGTIARRDGLREVEAEDMDGILAKVPEGYQLLSVRGA
ncbi:hypothetical protein MPMin1_gp72 [Microbacterium phage Min1]|uniref:Uncharacterized protein n=1 Tax=Microbacterium phage Min1 TaxID=446529 RepID=A6N230_9CAUD|nr:hypothetical protein MPMin1_gp72 [Microbacterium phage Min1]ABR10502.1 hypothetical protein [Microbacterium phage Min1]